MAALTDFDESAGQTSHPARIGVDTHMARHEDTLFDLAVEHNLGFIELAAANTRMSILGCLEKGRRSSCQ